MRDIVESNQWLDIVKQKSLPPLFLKLADELVDQTKELKKSGYAYEKHNHKIQCILRTAVREKHLNIFQLISDCLNAKQDPSIVRSHMYFTFQDISGANPSYADRSTKFFQLFLYNHCYAKPDEDHMKRVFGCLPPHQARSMIEMIPLVKSIPFSYWNKKETKANVELALDFLLQNSPWQTYDAMFQVEFISRCRATLYFFICNDYYVSLVHKCVEFLSKTCDDYQLADIFSSAFRYKTETNCLENLSDANIRQSLIMLQKLEKHKLVKEQLSQVLMIAPNVFEKVYLDSLDGDPTSDNNLLTSNSFGLTRLHKAVFETYSVNTIRGFINDSRLSKIELV